MPLWRLRARRYMINIKEWISNDGTLRIPTFLNVGSMKDTQGLRYQLQMVGHNTFDKLHDLKKLIIPATVTNMEWCFYQCYNMAEIIVDDDNPEFCSIDGVLFTKDKKKLYVYPNAHGKEYDIPEGVEEIMHFAFKSCKNIEVVRLSSFVRKIGINAFYECPSLKTVFLPDDFRLIEQCTDKANIQCEFIHKGHKYTYSEIIEKFNH